MLLFLLIAFFLRTYQLDHQALRGDEAATVLYAALPVTDLWELSRVTDPHPPFYYLMLHPWQWLFGETGWVMRFAGVVASTLAVAVLYRLGRESLALPTVSLLAAGLLAVNPLQVWQAQDIRSYPFFALFGLLSSWALWRSVVGSRKSVVSRQMSVAGSQMSIRPTSYVLRPWLLYIAFTVISLYTHYYTVFLIAFQGLFVVFNARRLWPVRWVWLVSQLLIGLLILPGLGLAYNFIGQAAGGIDTIPTLEIFRRALTALLTGFTLDFGPGLWAAILLTPFALLGLVNLLRRDIVSGSFWALYFLIPVGGVIALSIDRPFFKERFLTQAQPAFELLLAMGLLTLWFLPIKQLSNSHHYALRTTHYVLR
ncbi:MAG: glycosyltransferase family 39 protein, partial [Anaerolineae bacterium]|nr:glycosyltransferase family 39 protein [Anaerolineae bacterium]